MADVDEIKDTVEKILNHNGLLQAINDNDAEEFKTQLESSGIRLIPHSFQFLLQLLWNEGLPTDGIEKGMHLYNNHNVDKSLIRVDVIPADFLAYCQGFKKISIPYNKYEVLKSAYDSCPNIEEVSILSPMIQLGSGVFSCDSHLKRVNFVMATKIRLGNNCFDRCYDLTEVNFQNVIQRLEIGEGCFYSTGLESFDIPHGCTLIKDFAFKNCLRLKKVTIPNTVTYIGYQAFAYTGLTEVTVPASVTYLSDLAFVNTKDKPLTVKSKSDLVEKVIEKYNEKRGPSECEIKFIKLK